ncbi:MAG TPA: type II secretion system protein [Epsilonproteobacteria bacterium]|nr:type II secretion system protein [Campylobacterota bacterium]
MTNSHRQKQAFTMLELVLVIIVIGILAALSLPRLDRDIRQEAADNILSDIRYTQHMALIDDVTNPFDARWQRAFWRIGFNNCSGGGLYEYIGSDSNYGGGIGSSEAATDPANGKKMYWGTTPCPNGGNSTTSDRIFITHKYGITAVNPSSGCRSSNNYIGFDHLGRTVSGFTTSTTPNYSSYLTSNCTLTFTLSNGETFAITIEKETGYAEIGGQNES